MSGGLPFLLLAIGDAAQATPDGARGVAEAGGPAVALLLRDRALSAPERVAWAREVVPAAHAAGARVLVHGSPAAALLSGADGVHLPEGVSVAGARRELGPGALVGASRHDAGGVARAHHDGADYATLSPVFASPGKGAALGLPAFALVAATAPLPLVALGGVTADNAAACLRSGASAVAAITAVWDGSPGDAVRRILREIAARR